MKPGRLRFSSTIALSNTNISAAAAGVANVSQTVLGTALGAGPVEGTVTITCVGAEPTVRFLVKGTDGNGRSLIESVLGPGAAGGVRTINAFRTVTSVVPDRNTGANISVGWGAAGFASRLYPVDPINQVFQTAYRFDFYQGSTGTVTFQFTRSPVLGRRGSPDLTKPTNPNWFGTEFDIIHPIIDGTLYSDCTDNGIAITASTAASFAGQPTAVRILCTVVPVGIIDLHISSNGPYRTG